MTFENILISTITVFLVVGLGWFCHRIKIIDDTAERSLMTLAINVFYPCFILSKILGNDLLRQSTIVTAAMSAGLVLIVAAFGICYFFGRLIGLTRDSGLNTFTVGAALQNYGYIPIPLVERIFPGERGDQILGVLFVHNLGLEIALWTLGIVLISGSAAGAWKKLINGPSIALAVGLFFNFSQLHTEIPSVFISVISMLGPCAVPVSLILVGATLGGVIQKSPWRSDMRVISATIGLRFLLLPLLYGVTAYLIWFSDELRIVLLIQASMPCAIFPIVLARHYKGHPAIAVQTAISTSAACLLLTPLLLTFWFWLVKTSV
jgi:predicted permease